MINDLHGQGTIEQHADIIVIGAGTVGLPTSVLLAQRTGQRVITLESGGLHQDQDTHPLNEVVHLDAKYTGAVTGRFRCLGGTSTRWGGALIPFQSMDLEQEGWPLTLEDLEPYLPEVESLFDLEPGPYCDPSFPFDLGDSYVNRLAKWPSFGKRNVVALMGKEGRELPNLGIWIHANVVKISTGVDGDGVQLTACSPGGDSLRLSASRLIIAAGAIETTRLALLIDQQNDNVIRAVSPNLGRYFSDHISVGVAEIIPRRRNQLNKIFGFRFGDRGSMRNVRFELSRDSHARDLLPPSFVEMRFDLQRPGGFEALREVFRRLQKQQFPSLHVWWNLLCNSPWLARAIWWRFVHKRLLFPQNARLIAHAVIAQELSADNYIALSKSRKDRFGVPMAEMKWRVSDSDIANVARVARLFEQTWRGTGFAGFGTWEPFAMETISSNARETGAFLHPSGSTRLGRNASEGVVDRDLRLFSVPQIQLLATSVLPSAGGANPTMMLMLLALRCVDQHVKALAQSRKQTNLSAISGSLMNVQKQHD